MNSHEFTETSETEYSSNKNDPKSSLENSNHTKLNKLNLELALLKSLVSEQLIYIKKALQEINDLYQQNENTFTGTNTIIKQMKKKNEEEKAENKIKNSH